MAELSVGKKAPAFSLKDKDGTIHKLSAIDSEYTVVYFYPKDNTPGCTLEAQGFSSDAKKLEKLGVRVIGISGGDEASKEKFCSKYDLTIPLLSDPDFSVCKKYDCYGEKSFMGKKHLGIFRKTFILDSEKKIIKIYEKVDTKTHSRDVLEFIKGL